LLLFPRSSKKEHRGPKTGHIERNKTIILVLSVSHKIDLRKQSSSIAMDFNVQPERGKSSRKPRPIRHPIIIKADPQKANEPEETSTALGCQQPFHPWLSSLAKGLECKLTATQNV
jgi:hypothetical protein